MDGERWDNERIRRLASGKLTLGHRKSPFFIGKSPISMARKGIAFHSYVKLPLCSGNIVVTSTETRGSLMNGLLELGKSPVPYFWLLSISSSWNSGIWTNDECTGIPWYDNLAGGWPTPLKNDGVRQLGWFSIPNWMESHKTCSSHHQPATYLKWP